MADDIREISEITIEHGMFGMRHVVTVDGEKKKFRKVEKATDYRDEQIALQAEQRERRELEKLAAEQEAAEAQARAEYDQDPEYVAFEISPAFEDDKTNKLGFTVDGSAYSREIRDCCFEIWRRGYEVVSITPLISGFADKEKGAGESGGAGWGFSYTEGVVLLARKIRQADAAE